ncbi:unnamed protein product [Chrysoparadoxa australica]
MSFRNTRSAPTAERARSDRLAAARVGSDAGSTPRASGAGRASLGVGKGLGGAKDKSRPVRSARKPNTTVAFGKKVAPKPSPKPSTRDASGRPTSLAELRRSQAEACARLAEVEQAHRELAAKLKERDVALEEQQEKIESLTRAGAQVQRQDGVSAGAEHQLQALLAKIEAAGFSPDTLRPPFNNADAPVVSWDGADEFDRRMEALQSQAELSLSRANSQMDKVIVLMT